MRKRVQLAWGGLSLRRVRPVGEGVRGRKKEKAL